MSEQNVSIVPESNPFHALEIVVPEIRKALKRDDSELALAYLAVVEWAVDVLAADALVEALDDL